MMSFRLTAVATDGSAAKRRLWASLASAAVAAAIAPVAGMAESAPPAGDSGQTGELQEVIVTAERREEDLQKTPISVTVMSGEEMRTQGVSQLSDVLKNVAGVLLQGGTNYTEVSIRGISSDLPGGSGQAAVAETFDNVYSALPGSTQLGYYDVARVEVLRGPQTTLYGRNASGGVVATSFQDPVLGQTTGYALVEGGNYNLIHTEAAANVPIGSAVALRAAFMTIDRSGYISNGAGDDVGKGGRLKAMWKPNDDLSIIVTGEYIKLGGQGQGAFVPGPEYAAGNYWTNNFGRAQNNVNETNWKTYLVANWNMGFASLSLQPSYIKDYSENYAFVYGAQSGGPGGSGGGTLTDNFAHESSFEARLSSSASSTVVWNLGYYYYDGWQHNGQLKEGGCYDAANNQYLYGAPGYEYNTTLASGCSGASLVQLPNRDLGQLFTGGTNAFFGQVTVPLTSQWRLLAGARYNDDKAGLTNYAAAFMGGGPPAGPPRSGKYTAFDWRLGSEYDITGQSMAYFTVSTSHRDGGFNPFGTTFAQEKLISFEVGAKNRFLDNRLQVNADFFYYDYTDWQYFTFIPAPPTAACILSGPPGSTSCLIGSNAPKTSEYGLEMDTQFYLTQDDLLRFSGVFSHSAFGHPFVPPDSGTDLGGEPLPHQPQVSLNGGYSHTFHFTDSSALIPRFDFQYVSSQWLFPTYGTPAETISALGANSHEPGHWTEDASLNYNWEGGKWSVNGYVHNLSNKAYRTGIQPGNGPNPSANVNLTVNNPRTYGATLQVHF